MIAWFEPEEKVDPAIRLGSLCAQNYTLQGDVNDVRTFYAQLPVNQEFYIPNYI